MKTPKEKIAAIISMQVRDKRIVRMSKLQSHDVIAASLGMTRQRVQQICAKGRKL